MKNFDKIYEIVEKMLEESINARNDDTHLYFRLLRHLGFPVKFYQRWIRNGKNIFC